MMNTTSVATAPRNTGLVSTMTGTRPALRPPAGPIRVVVADDHPVVRKGVIMSLNNREQIQVVGEATNGQEAVRKAKDLAPDVLLMDLEMPLLNGLTAAETLRKEAPGVKVLFLSMHHETEHVVRILSCGARGYVLKQAAPAELVQAIETVQGGGTCFSPEVARAALNQYVNGSGANGTLAQISNREREVLVAIAEGLSNKEIACRLNLGVRTVETHRERVMRKLNIHSIAGLTRFAIQKGLIPLAA